MQIIALVNQKGGVSKSTTAIHLAYWLQCKEKYKVLLVDADSQRSSSQWLEGADFDIDYQILSEADEILEQVPDLAEDYDYVIIDGSASLAENTRAILFVSDLAVIPVQASGVDLRSANKSLRIVKQAQKVRGGLPKATVFLSRAVKGTTLKQEAIAYLKELGETGVVTPLTTVIHQKQVIADTSGQNATVFNLSGRSATESANEYQKLFNEVMEVGK